MGGVASHLLGTSRPVATIAEVASIISATPSILLDPSDLTSMWTTSTGTTQVASDGDTVGLILDVAQMGGVAASTYIAARSELVTNGDFSGGTTTGWTASGATLAVVSGECEVTAASGGLYAYQGITTVVGQWYRFFVGTSRMGTAASIRTRIGNTANGTDIVNLTTDLTNYQFWFRATATTTYLTFNANAAGTIYFDNVSLKAIPGNHAFQATAGSRPLYKTSGGVNYLLFDGSDDSLATGTNLDLSGTQKVSVFLGVRKLSDAATGIVLEHGVSPTDTQAWTVQAPRSGGSIPNPSLTLRDATYYAEMRGANTAAPVSYIVSATGDYTGATIPTQVGIRTNGVAGTTQAGTGVVSGSFSSKQLFIGKRGAATAPFNGYIYGLAIGGKLCTMAEIGTIENWINQKMGGSII